MVPRRKGYHAGIQNRNQATDKAVYNVCLQAFRCHLYIFQYLQQRMTMITLLLTTKQIILQVFKKFLGFIKFNTPTAGVLGGFLNSAVIHMGHILTVKNFITSSSFFISSWTLGKTRPTKKSPISSWWLSHYSNIQYNESVPHWKSWFIFLRFILTTWMTLR